MRSTSSRCRERGAAEIPAIRALSHASFHLFLIQQHFLRRLQVLLVQLPDRPQQPARHQIEVTSVFDGCIVVAESCTEDVGLAVVLVGPDHDRFRRRFRALLVLEGLLAAASGWAVSCSLPIKLL